MTAKLAYAGFFCTHARRAWITRIGEITDAEASAWVAIAVVKRHARCLEMTIGTAKVDQRLFVFSVMDSFNGAIQDAVRADIGLVTDTAFKGDQ